MGDATSRRLIVTAIRRGLRRKCPHCGEGPLFKGWSGTIDACPVCHLVYEPNAGDTWAFTIFGDRIPVAAALAIVYFGVGRLGALVGTVALTVTALALIYTSPNRWGVGIALHYLSRVFWPDPLDPLPARRDAPPVVTSGRRVASPQASRKFAKTDGSDGLEKAEGGQSAQPEASS